MRLRIAVTDNDWFRSGGDEEEDREVPKEAGQHHLDNGLLLRTDVHRLFDKGYVTVTPDGRFLLSRRLKDDFDNGEPYMPFQGQRMWIPGDPGSREGLEWHSDTVFLG